MNHADLNATRSPNEFAHFEQAQQSVYPQVLRELSHGAKTSHWMWFIFPQLRGLGSSPMAERFALASLAQAQRYLAHALLGARLRECTQLALAARARSVEEFFGYPDYLKFRSSLTLFSCCEPAPNIFTHALDTYFAGEPDARTLHLLGKTPAI